jgi:hypothetical protein
VLLIRLTILGVFVGIASAQNLPANRSKQDNHAQSQTNNPCSAAPLCHYVQIQPIGEKEQSTSKDQPHDWDHWEEAFWPATWSNWALAVLALWAGYMAWKAIRFQKATDRAWITVKGIFNLSQPIDSPGYVPSAIYDIEVTGNPPVRIIRERFRCRIVPVIPGTNPAQPLLEKTQTFKSEEGIFPRGSVNPSGYRYQIPAPLEYGKPLTPEELIDLRNGKKILCAYGCIEYQDAFRHPHYTRVCSVYRFYMGEGMTDRDGKKIDPSGFRVSLTKGYNDYT